jgi:creatinine amidohydrolase
MEAHAAGPARLLEEMSWPEVERALADGRTTVVVAVAAIEQHGPHLPLLVDAARGDRLALEVATRLGDEAVVAPTIRVGCSEHHMSFPGTISLRRSTLEAICMDYCVSLARHGFRRICLVPSHGGNFGPLSDMLDDLRAAVAPECDVLAYTDLIGFMDVWTEAVRAASGPTDHVGGHADVAETSEMMVIRPDLVREDRLAAGYVGGTDPAVFQRIFAQGLRAVTDNGILGDAHGATPEIGRRCIERAADAVARAFRAD